MRFWNEDVCWDRTGLLEDLALPWEELLGFGCLLHKAVAMVGCNNRQPCSGLSSLAILLPCLCRTLCEILKYNNDVGEKNKSFFCILQ